jgi:hypothetical protein
VALVGAPSAYCCGGERSAYCYDGAEEIKGGDGEEEKGGYAAAAMPHAVAPVGAPIMYSCGGAEERKGLDGDAAAMSRTQWRPWERQARRRWGFTASGEVSASRAAARNRVGSIKIKCLGAIR